MDTDLTEDFFEQIRIDIINIMSTTYNGYGCEDAIVLKIRDKIEELEKQNAELVKFQKDFSPLAAYLARECCTVDGDLLYRFKSWLQAHNLEQQAKGANDFARAHGLQSVVDLAKANEKVLRNKIKALKDGE